MLRCLICIFFLLVISLFAKAQNFSNKGKDFWVGYGYHQAMVGSDNNQDMILYFTSDVSATVKVEIPGVGWVKTYQVSANTVTESDPMPKSGSQDARLYSDSLYNTGIHITSDNPVVAYAHIYSSTNSAASLLFPVNTLGQDYYSLNFTQKANTYASNSWAFVIATEDNTLVEIIPSAKTLTHAAGESFTVALNKGQIYNIMGETNDINNNYSGVDLTGTRIRSVSTGTQGCKRIAVFSGSGRVSINCENAVTSSDNLFQQVFPPSAWGKKFLTVPTTNLPNNYFRIAVSDPLTIVTIDSVQATNLINNFYYEINANTPKSIVSDKPVMVAQYITSSNDDVTSPCGNSFNYNGDPEMIYLSPLEQTIDNITLNSTNHYQITSHYINVVIKASAVNSFTLDGVASASDFKPHPGDPAYSYAVFSVKQGTHNLRADSGFNAIAYGYGVKESYGYNAGTNIKNLYQFITLQNPYAISNNTCSNTPFLMSVTLPYQPTSLMWDFGNNPNITPSENITQNNPVPDSTYTIDGRTLYVYKLTNSYTFGIAGTFPVNIIADNQSSDGCNGQQQLIFDIEVFPAPVADFTFNHTGCATDSVLFFDASNGNGKPISKWNWDFGNGTIETVKNPGKTYESAGSYNVKLTSVNDIGCFDEIIKPVTLAPKPAAKFGFSAQSCVNDTVTFTDSSTVSAGSIVKWYWKFGNGDSIINTTNASVTKIYNIEGIYTVSLIVENNEGCKSDTIQQILTVVPSPVSNFILPEICVNDDFATFTDSSYIPGGGGSLIYAWSFGDQNATVLNPDTSTDQNPKHKFTAPGFYNISLTTATSGTGCISTTTKPFAVNGVPQANFSVIDSASLCSNTEVQIQNSSTVSPGSITKIEITWDVDNAPETTVTDNDAAAGEIYSHTYSLIQGAQTYQVKVRAFSGINCFDEKEIPVTIQPSPKVTFSAVPGICLSDSAYTITQATETTGLPGTFVFTGNGVSPAGVFSASQAGEIPVRYTYTSTEGCKDSAEQTITVVQIPTVQLPPRIYVLEQGSVVLQPQITGNVTEYVWSPGTWLDNANIQTPRSTPASDITYRLTVSAAAGCKAFDDVTVSLLTAPIIPNAFSPNGDGINDVWNIPSLGSFENSSVQVFNRYGKLVFNSTGYHQPWDGKYNGSSLPLGVYYYIINTGKGKKPYSGSLTILK